MTLADEIAEYLAGGRPETAEHIARAIQARTYNVRYVLRADPRFVLRDAERQKPHVKRYTVLTPGRAGDGAGRPKETHNERVLQLLSDGQPHSHLELYDLRVVAHSRVAALRKQGHTIECWREGSIYFYQLIQEEEVAA